MQSIQDIEDQFLVRSWKCSKINIFHDKKNELLIVHDSIPETKLIWKFNANCM